MDTMDSIVEEMLVIDSEHDSSAESELNMDAIDPCTEQIVTQDPALIAEENRRLGNQQYKAQNYEAALKHYTDAILLCPDSASYYTNRSACYIMLSNYTHALNDARIAAQMEPSFERAHLRIAKCCLALGDIVGGEQAIKKALELRPRDESIQEERQKLQQLRKLEATIARQYRAKSYRNVVYYLDNALRFAPACLRYRLLRAECLVFLGRYEEAVDIAVSVMKLDHTSADAIYVRGLYLFYTDQLDKSVTHFERALLLDPDHQKARDMRNKCKALKELKERGNMFFKLNHYRDAHGIYSEALKIDSSNKQVNSKLLYNRALVNCRLGELRASITDCTAVLEINAHYLKALLLRARCYMDLQKFGDSVKDYEAALGLQPTQDIRKLLREAKLAQKKSHRKDYYQILGLSNSATDDQIKKAYRKLALVHHPDRHANSSPEERKAEERKFKEIGEAYSVLSDRRKKLVYDAGQDSDDQEPDINTSQVFRTFFQFTTSPESGTQTFSFDF